MGKEIVIASLIALTVLAVYYSTNESRIDAFEEWKGKFGVSWAPEEQAYRRLIFEKNVIAIQRHNADHTQTYKKGTNQFTIYSDEEFIEIFLTSVPSIQDNPKMIKSHYSGAQIIDWTTKDGVTRVKNQGRCGSCWAFSAVAVIQSWHLINTKQTVDLSEQQLVDCSTSFGNHGCNGGNALQGLKYVIKNGIASQQEYPYAAVDQTCAKSGGDFKISGADSIPGCDGLINKIVQRPISIHVDASNWSAYRSGIFDNCATNTNHAVLLVGVLDNGVWKVKNSWGQTWGEQGFIKLSAGNTCGICKYDSYVPK